MRSIHLLAFGLGAASLFLVGCGGEVTPSASGSTTAAGTGGTASTGSGATTTGSGGGAAGAGGATTSTSSTGMTATTGSSTSTGSGGSAGAGGAGSCMTDADCGSQGCVPGTCVGGICYYFACDADCDGVNGVMCGGSDCDDSDPAIPAASESCGNGKDDDCNGWIDVADPACGLQNDTCASAADASAGGTFMGTTQGAAGDYNVMGLPDLVYGVTTAVPLEAHVGLTIPALPPGWMWPNEGVNFGVWLGPGCNGAMYNGFYCAGGGGPLCGALPATQSFCQRLVPGTFSVVVGIETTQSMLGYPFTLDLGLVPPPAMPCGALTDVSSGGAFPLDPLDPKWTNALGECGSAGTKEAVFSLSLAADTSVLLEGSERDGDLRVLPACDPAAVPLDSFGKPFGYASEYCQGTLPAGSYLVVKELGPLKFGLTSADLHVTLAPPGSECAGAPVVTATSSLQGTTAGAPSRMVVWTDWGLGPEAVYQLDLTAQKRVVADVIASYSNAIVYIERACAASQGASFSNFQPQHRDGVLDPGTYWVVVDGRGAADAGDFVLNLTLLNPP